MASQNETTKIDQNIGSTEKQKVACRDAIGAVM